MLYDVGLDLFAHKESKMKNPNPIQPFLKLHNKIKELRIEKRDCKKLFKSTTDGQVLQNIRDKWCSLVRLHSRLSKKLKSKISMKEKQLTEKNFRKNPFAFAQKIPFDPVDGNPDTPPSFNKDEADSFFKETYSDDSRNYTFEPIAEMIRPPAPETMMRLDTTQLFFRSDKLSRKKETTLAVALMASHIQFFLKSESALSKLLTIIRFLLNGSTSDSNIPFILGGRVLVSYFTKMVILLLQNNFGP